VLFEKLHLALVFFRRGPAGEGAAILAFTVRALLA
jgi:hypothetical protein